MSTRRKKVLYLVAATMGMGLLIGAATIYTGELMASPIMIPFAWGMWMGIICAITIVVRDYKAIGNGK